MSGRITPTRPLPAAKTDFSWSIAEKLLSNEVTLRPPDEAGDPALDAPADAAEDAAGDPAADGDAVAGTVVAPLLHPVTTINDTATVASTDGRVLM